MDAKEIIKAIHDAPKKTPVKAYIKSKVPLSRMRRCSTA